MGVYPEFPLPRTKKMAEQERGRRLREYARLSVVERRSPCGVKLWKFRGECGASHELDLRGMRALATFLAEEIARQDD